MNRNLFKLISTKVIVETKKEYVFYLVFPLKMFDNPYLNRFTYILSEVPYYNECPNAVYELCWTAFTFTSAVKLK